jgi:hypothetical protein
MEGNSHTVARTHARPLSDGGLLLLRYKTITAIALTLAIAVGLGSQSAIAASNSVESDDVVSVTIKALRGSASKCTFQFSARNLEAGYTYGISLDFDGDDSYSEVAFGGQTDSRGSIRFAKVEVEAGDVGSVSHFADLYPVRTTTGDAIVAWNPTNVRMTNTCIAVQDVTITMDAFALAVGPWQVSCTDSASNQACSPRDLDAASTALAIEGGGVTVKIVRLYIFNDNVSVKINETTPCNETGPGEFYTEYSCTSVLRGDRISVVEKPA